MKRSHSLFLALAAMAVVGLASTAHAGITVTLDPGVTPNPSGTGGAGPFGYSYDIGITPSDSIVTGDFFRIYDFLGYDGVSSSPADWTLTVTDSNPVPPPNVILSHGDDPTVENLTWTYTGTTTITGATTIPGFNAESVDDLLGGLKDYVGRDTQATGPTAGSNVDSVGSVQVPGLPQGVPEPASLAVLGLGSLLMLRRRSAR